MEETKSENKPRTTFRACLVGAYLFSVPAFSYSDSLGLLMIPQILGAVLVAYAVLDILSGLRISIPSEIGLYGLLGLWAALTFYLGASLGDWGTLSLGTLIKVVTATLACSQLIKDENDFFTALKFFVFSIVLVYIQNIGDLRYLRIAGQITDTERFAGTLADANTAAVFSLTVIWASMLLWLHSKKRLSSRIGLLVPIGISLLLLYYSGSKKGLFGLGLFVLFVTRLLYIRQRTSLYKKGLVLLASSALVITVGYFVYASPFFFRIQQLFMGGSTGDINRYYLAKEAIHIWLMNGKTFFMGVGYDNFRWLSDLQAMAHATPLELLAGTGIIGFSLFMGFFFLLYRKYIFLYRYALTQDSKVIFFSIIIFLSIYLFFILGEVLHASRELMPILGGLAVFGQYHLRRVRQSRVNELSPPVL